MRRTIQIFNFDFITENQKFREIPKDNWVIDLTLQADNLTLRPQRSAEKKNKDKVL